MVGISFLLLETTLAHLSRVSVTYVMIVRHSSEMNAPEALFSLALLVFASNVPAVCRPSGAVNLRCVGLRVVDMTGIHHNIFEKAFSSIRRLTTLHTFTK